TRSRRRARRAGASRTGAAAGDLDRVVVRLADSAGPARHGPGRAASARQGTRRTAVSRGSRRPGSDRGATGRPRPAGTGQAVPGMARIPGRRWKAATLVPVQGGRGRRGCRGRRSLSGLDLPGHRLRPAAEAGDPLALDGGVAAAPAHPATPPEHVARAAEPAVEGVRRVVERTDRTGLPDRLLQLGQTPGTTGRETTGVGRLGSLGNLGDGGGRLHDLLRRKRGVPFTSLSARSRPWLKPDRGMRTVRMALFVGAVRAVCAPSGGQEKDWPQPQVRVVLGLLIVNPAPIRPSL